MDIKIAHARIENKILICWNRWQHWPGRWVLNTTTLAGENVERDLKKSCPRQYRRCCSDKVHREIVARFELAEDWRII